MPQKRRIIYLCPADNKATGGIKVIYRHAELLAFLGANAYVLHPFDLGFSCTWFDHRAQTLPSSALNPEGDFVIIPEIWAGPFGQQCIEQRVRYAIFVQNGYYSRPILPEHSYEMFDHVYRCAELVLSISEDSTNMVMLNYPRLDPARFVRSQYSIHERFLTEKRASTTGPRTISFMPRKMASHAVLVVSALRRHLPAQWRILAIDNVNETTVAEVLSESCIFLSFSEFEGLPLPPLEAALAGNLVIGYTGQGAREYWLAPNFQEIHQGDVYGFVTAVCQAVMKIDAQQLTHADLMPGIKELAGRYSLATETMSLRLLLNRIERGAVHA